MNSLRIGTSGWIYRHWRGIFYPEKLPQREWLYFYMQHFNTVEVNFSFYRLPSRETFEGWRQKAAPGFVYAVKGSRYITHLKRLRDPAEHVSLLFDHLEGLGAATGPILWQLPPDFKRDDDRLIAFLDTLPAYYRHTIEFRHRSWLVDSVFDALAARDVALCIPDRPGLPQDVRTTTSWTYIRFHAGAGPRGDYTNEQLDLWAARIRRFLGDGKEVWAYFNNDWEGFALKDATALCARLG